MAGAIVALLLLVAPASAVESVGWNVVDGHAQQPAVISGIPQGEPITFDGVITWDMAGTIERVGQVYCLDGVSGHDKYATISNIQHDGKKSVSFRGEVYSYDRAIQFRSSVFEVGTGTRYFSKDITLRVKPAAPIDNPPWSESVGQTIVSEWATRSHKMTVRDGESITWINQRYVCMPPAKGRTIEATIKRLVPWHPHAPANLYPTVAVAKLSDGTGAILTFGRLRPFTRYAVRIVDGSSHVIYVRTEGP